MADKRKVVVTGLGVVSSVGIGKDVFWQAVIKGTSGISKVTSFDTSGFKRNYGGEIKNFEPAKFIDRRKLKFFSKTSQLAISASKLALSDSQINLKDLQNYKSGVLIGTTMGERALEDILGIWIKGNLKPVDKSLVIQSVSSNISSNIAIYFNIFGINLLIPTACAAGNYALGYGFDLIQRGELDIALVGGADVFSKIAFSGFQRLYAMAPEKCQPFDKNRKGMLLGEGAGILILESLERALKRQANIYAEVLGYGLSCDAFHINIPKRGGIEKAMAKAIRNSGLRVDNIDYINAHGTGTVQNDKEETAAIKDLFGKRYKEIPVNSIKSMLGHSMGAASSIESIVCCLALKKGILPPTINFETPDPECDIDCVPNKARKVKINTALNNSFAFGGNNCCVVFKRYGSK